MKIFGEIFATAQPAAEFFVQIGFLSSRKPETRQYKALFFRDKSEIGLSSDVVPATATP